jgi:hypothetical protein
MLSVGERDHLLRKKYIARLCHRKQVRAPGKS